MMELFFSHVREHLIKHASELLDLFDVMAGEARFSRAWLESDLASLSKESDILEVGGGIFLLSCLLAREGFRVTAIEPTGSGFGAFERLGAIVIEVSSKDADTPTIVRTKAEDFTTQTQFDFIYSVNVMEHVDSPEHVIERMSQALKPNASYHFFCPNYRFPYEPHFNIPTFGSKRLTEKLMRKAIFDNTSMDDPLGVWKSLNWITVGAVRRIVARDASLVMHCNTQIFPQMLERAVSDSSFASRRSGWVVATIRQLVRLKIHRLAGLIPAMIQPAMDVRLTKKS